MFPGITRSPFFLSGLTHFCLGAGDLSPNSLLNPSFAGLGLFFGATALVFAFFCCGVSLACSFGDELDFATEGRSASVGEGLGFGFDTGGGDLVKKLKRELCLAMLKGFFDEPVKCEHKNTVAVLSAHLLAKSHTGRESVQFAGKLRGGS